MAKKPDTEKMRFVRTVRTQPEIRQEVRNGLNRVTGTGFLLLHDGRRIVSELRHKAGDVTMTKLKTITGLEKVDCAKQAVELRLKADVESRITAEMGDELKKEEAVQKVREEVTINEK